MTDVSADTGAVSEGGAEGAVDAGAEGAGGGEAEGNRLFEAFQQFQSQQEERLGRIEQRLPEPEPEADYYEDEPFDGSQFFEDSRFGEDDFEDDGALSRDAQLRALADMQRAIVQEELRPVLEAQEDRRRDREAEALEQRYTELADEETARGYVQEAIQAANTLGQPALAREPGFLEMVYLAAKARERAGQEIPAGSAPGVTLETGPGGSPAAGVDDSKEAANRIVNAGRRGFRPGG